MEDPEEIVDPAVLDFIQDFEDDVAEGTHRPLGFYLKRYPEAETQVAGEFLRRRAATDEEAKRQANEPDGERIGRYRIVGALGPRADRGWSTRPWMTAWAEASP